LDIGLLPTFGFVILARVWRAKNPEAAWQLRSLPRQSRVAGVLPVSGGEDAGFLARGGHAHGNARHAGAKDSNSGPHGTKNAALVMAKLQATKSVP